jgi:hypothetical protein
LAVTTTSTAASCGDSDLPRGSVLGGLHRSFVLSGDGGIHRSSALGGGEDLHGDGGLPRCTVILLLSFLSALCPSSAFTERRVWSWGLAIRWS